MCWTSTSRGSTRPSSSRRERGSPGPRPQDGRVSLLDATFARGPVSAGAAAGPAGDAWLVALLEVEGALARAAARVGLVAGTSADEVSRACADPARLDLAAVYERAADAGNPVPP